MRAAVTSPRQQALLEPCCSGRHDAWPSNMPQQAMCQGRPRVPRKTSQGTCAASRDQGQWKLPASGVASSGLAPSAEEQQQPLVWTTYVAETLLPTGQGKFRLRGYRHTVDGGRTYTEPTAIIAGEVEGLEDVPCRVHDACFTSEVLGSLKCDCREQLALAMDRIQADPPGMVIYLQQEGRGIGLANKIAAYALQEKGLDTVDANRALGLPDDCREYSPVAHILEDLGVRSIRLMTNNPRKMESLAALGVSVTGRIPCQVAAQAHNRGYLDAKQRRMQHMLERSSRGGSMDEEPAPAVGEVAEPGAAAVGVALGELERAELERELGYPSSDEEVVLDGSYCFWDHEGEPGPAGIPLAAQPAPPGGAWEAAGGGGSAGDATAGAGLAG